MASFAPSQVVRSPSTSVTPRAKPLRLVARAHGGTGERSAAKPSRFGDLSQLVKPAMIAAVSNVVLALPAAAEGGKLFDFNLTGPIMAGEFLLLMVFLDKFWFGPVGKILDERDGYIRDKLAAVSGGTDELASLQAQTEAVLKDARAAAQAKIQEARAANQAEMDAKVEVAKKSVDAELESALAALDKERESAMQNLDAQVDKLSAEILKKILPEGVSV